MPTKAGLRRAILSRLQSQSAEKRQTKSRQIAHKLFKLKDLEDAKLVCLYVSLPMEVNTRLLITRLLKQGKKVAVPVADLQKRALRFFEIKDLKKDLRKGALGILEPDPMRTRPISVKEIGFVCVPGVAFDRKNNRLGRGAGFYDRFLKKLNKRVPKVALAFDFQCVAHVPVEKHDVRLDQVLTEKS